MSSTTRRAAALIGTALVGSTLIAPPLFGTLPTASATSLSSTSADHATTADDAVTLTATIDSVDAARGSAVISGVVSGADDWFIVLNDYTQDVTRTGTTWTGTVERLLPGENTISIEVYDGSFREIASTVLRTTIGSGQGFTAAATRAADGTVTASGAAPTGETVHATSALSVKDYGSDQVGADGRWSIEIPAGELDETQSIRIDFGDPERPVRGIPIASITDESGVPARPVAFTSPVDGDTTGTRPVFTGTGADRATVVVTDAAGTELGRTVVHDGTWSVPSEIDLRPGQQTITATQTTADGRVTTA
jgi:hypothetical protein